MGGEHTGPVVLSREHDLDFGDVAGEVRYGVADVVIWINKPADSSTSQDTETEAA